MKLKKTLKNIKKGEFFYLNDIDIKRIELIEKWKKLDLFSGLWLNQNINPNN
jgi:hypothetical protein